MKREYPTFKVRLKTGGSIEVKCVAYQPCEPSAYVWEPFWEAESETGFYFVYVSGNVSEWNEETDSEIENIGYVPAILRENKKDREEEERLGMNNF